MDGCFVTDEWIVGGFYFAVAINVMYNDPWKCERWVMDPGRQPK